MKIDDSILHATYSHPPKRPTRDAFKARTAGGPGSGNFGHAGRPGQIGGSAPGEGGPGSVARQRVNRDWVQKVQHNDERAMVIERAAARADMTPEEFVQSRDRIITNAVKDAHVFVRLPEDVLEGVMESGRVQNQFESKRSQGLLDQGTRDRLEEGLFGIESGESDPAKRPIYGYLGGEDGQSENGWLDSYGLVRVRLKDEAKARTTFTVGDSLDATFEYSGSDANYPQDGTLKRPVLAPQPILEPSSLAYDFGTKTTGYQGWSAQQAQELFDDVKTIDDLAEHGVDHYVEAQIHGGIDLLKDVESIHWPRSIVPDWLVKAQKQYGFKLTTGRGEYAGDRAAGSGVVPRAQR